MMILCLFIVLVATVLNNVSATGGARPHYNEVQDNHNERHSIEIFSGDKMIYHAVRDTQKGEKATVSEGDPPMILVNIGKTAWNIIQSNKAVVNYETDWAGAIPAGYEDDWIGLAGWEDVKSEEFRFHYKIAGDTVSELKGRFRWSAEGYTVENGEHKGHYVQNAGFAIERLYAKVGQTVNANVNARSPINYGTVEQPIGGIDIEVLFGSANNFNEEVTTCTVTLRGDKQYEVKDCKANDP